MKYKAVIFDLYGTLVANFSESAHQEILRQMAGVLGVSPEEFARLWFDTYEQRAIGEISGPEDNIRYVCNKLGASPDEGRIREAARIRYDFTKRNLKPWPEALPVISRLKALGYRLALISDCSAETPASWQDTDLAPLMDATVFSCSVGLKKPDPGIFLAATAQLGVSPEDCLYVGDGASEELTGAKKVGMHPVMVRSVMETPDIHRIHEEKWEGPRISSLTEVLTLIADKPRDELSLTRVQAIVIHEDRVLFGFGKNHHFFIGGRLEKSETAEQGVLRELAEEANVSGTIVFGIAEPGSPSTLASAYNSHLTFLVDIGEQIPRVGYDPEETDVGEDVSLLGIQMIPLEQTESFTRIDIDYFKSLVDECHKRNATFPWLSRMESLIARWRQK